VQTLYAIVNDGGGDFYPSDVEDSSPSKIAYLFMVVDK
jgi:hypothetical protein